ncbi:MAG: glycosyltransferase family 1 protein [Desulfovibrionaceae bacterium]|nr:glycosyltransferase family 1 protein [Desulfovibrionaceae bacterium]MBF0514046.1 glycosyltransferase family 1 protein [Desulfovibrionaceae bacterium]
MARTYVYIPPVKHTAGGIAVLCRLAARLCALGFDCALAARDASWQAPDNIEGLGDVAVVEAGQARPEAGDVWLVPEGWPTALAPGLASKARVVVYCQNWAYLLANLPEALVRHTAAVSWLAVSHPVAWLMEYALGVSAPVLRPGVDLGLFRPPAGGLPGGKPLGASGDTLTVAYMPRKNKALAGQIREIFSARARARGTYADWLEIKDMDQAGVAAALRRAHIFLATGFPEGCPLPPLEAMACGCLPVGFSGFGGLDYLRQIFPDDYQSWLPPREAPFGGNAVFTADADSVAAAMALERAAALWLDDGPVLRQALEQGQATARAYDTAAFAASVKSLWTERFWEKQPQ